MVGLAGRIGRVIPAAVIRRRGARPGDVSMATHELKSWPEQSRVMWTGRKRAEFRRDDRLDAVGDLLDLRERDPAAGQYTALRRTARVTQTHTTWGPANEITEGFALLSIEVPGVGGWW
jgi:hypothetical protein